MDSVFFLFLTVLYSYISSLVGPIDFTPSSSQLSVSGTVQAMVDQIQTEGIYTVTPTEEDIQIILSDRTNNSTPEATITMVPTLVPSPTLTLKEMMGEPKLSENFSRGSTGFGITQGKYEDETILLSTVTNGLLIEPKMSNGWKTWRLRPPSVGASIVEMDFSFLSCVASDQIGIVMHAQNFDEGNGYYFGIECSGLITLYRDNTPLAAADASGILNKDPTQLNRLSARINGSLIELYLNETKALEIRDTTYPQGYSGFFTAPAYAGTLKALAAGFYIYY